MSAPEPSQTWVIGADGIIGSALTRALRLARVPVQSTTRRREHATESVRFLDLAAADTFDPGHNPGIVYLCAAITDMQRCEADAAATQRINVNAVCRLAKRCADRGAHLVFLSSNAVFNGRSAAPSESSAVNPSTEYGRQKAQAEKCLAGLGVGLALVRITKVLSARMPLLRQWRDTLDRGQAIYPFRDLLMAPVSLRYVVTALIAIGSARHCGLFHLSGQRDLSYAQFALRYAETIGAGAHLVVAQAASREALAFRPLHATLDMSVTTAQTGFQAQSPFA